MLDRELADLLKMHPNRKGPIDGSNFFFAVTRNSGFHKFIDIHIILSPSASGFVEPLMSRIDTMN